MRSHMGSIGVGAGMAVVGLVLWMTTGDINTPVVSLSKIGVVLMVLGVVEVTISAVTLAMPAMRHRSDSR